MPVREDSDIPFYGESGRHSSRPSRPSATRPRPRTAPPPSPSRNGVSQTLRREISRPLPPPAEADSWFVQLGRNLRGLAAWVGFAFAIYYISLIVVSAMSPLPEQTQPLVPASSPQMAVAKASATVPVKQYSAPRITRVEFPARISSLGTPTYGRIHFEDADGDLREAVLSKHYGDFDGLTVDARSVNTTKGTVGFHLWCNSAGNRTIRIELTDSRNLRSATKYLSFSCSSSSAQQVTPTPEPRSNAVTSFKVNKFTFKLGENIHFTIELKFPGYSYLIDRNAYGKWSLLYPNTYQRQNWLAGGQHELPDSSFHFSASEPIGRDSVYLVVTSVPISSSSWGKVFSKFYSTAADVVKARIIDKLGNVLKGFDALDLMVIP